MHDLAPWPSKRATLSGVEQHARTVRFDGTIFTAAAAVLCPRQHHIAALGRALDAKSLRPCRAGGSLQGGRTGHPIDGGGVAGQLRPGRGG